MPGDPEQPQEAQNNPEGPETTLGDPEQPQDFSKLSVLIAFSTILGQK